jgi:hypothetical protein
MEVEMATFTRVAAAALVFGLVGATDAMAFRGGGGGGSQDGDSYENDMQRNPRLIEPGGEQGRYLAYSGRQGWDARQQAAGRVPYGYRGPQGRVDVAPYGSYYRP